MYKHRNSVRNDRPLYIYNAVGGMSRARPTHDNQMNLSTPFVRFTSSSHRTAYRIPDVNLPTVSGTKARCQKRLKSLRKIAGRKTLRFRATGTYR